MVIYEVKAPNLDRVETVFKGECFNFAFDFELGKIKEVTENILSKNKLARNSDEYLFFMVWTMQKKALRTSINGDEGFFIPFKSVYSLNAASIERVRRLLNSQGQYLPDDPEVIRKRRIRESEFKEYFSGEVKQ